MSLHSLRLGLIGKAVAVEFHRRLDSAWRPFSVEYKRGKPKADDYDKVQLRAQAICLEEMLSVAISEGAWIETSHDWFESGEALCHPSRGGVD